MRSRYFLIALVVIIAGIFLSRLYYLQVSDDQYKFLATSNTRRDYVIYPPRGYIYDRNDSLIVSNQPAYNLCAIYSQLPIERDSAGIRRVVIDTTALSKLREQAEVLAYFQKGGELEMIRVNSLAHTYINFMLYDVGGLPSPARNLLTPARMQALEPFFTAIPALKPLLFDTK